MEEVSYTQVTICELSHIIHLNLIIQMFCFVFVSLLPGGDLKFKLVQWIGNRSTTTLLLPKQK